MKVVFLGCNKFKGTDICGFQYKFYKDNFKPGDVFDIVPDLNDHLSSIITIYFNQHDPIGWSSRPIISLPREYFITLEEWREIKLNQIGI